MLTIIKVLIIIKVFHHAIPTLPVGTAEHPVNFQKKSVYKLSFQLSLQIYSLLAQTEGERETFSGQVQEGEPHCNITT